MLFRPTGWAHDQNAGDPALPARGDPAVTPQPPSYPGPGYPPPGYPGYRPPDYGYGPPGHPPGYPPYSAPGYGPWGYPPPGHRTPDYGSGGLAPSSARPPALQPGVIPLRPLSLSDIYNGAVSYIRANPKVTLGLSAIVVVISWVITLLTRAGPLAVVNRLAAGSSSYQLSGREVVVWGMSLAVGAIMTSLATIVLVGMLTVVVGRAVFASSITVGEAWAMVRGRFPALIGLAALLAVAAAALVGLGVFLIAVAIANAAAALIAIPLILTLIVALGYLYVLVSFAPTVIVLERLGVFAAIGRSFTLIRNSFWRVLGILLLTALITYLVTSAVSLPFDLVGMALGDGTTGALAAVSIPGVLSEVGTALGQIVALPFTAGVVVLLYTDRRIRAEAFDLVLRTGAGGELPTVGSTDGLWLTRPPR